MKNKTIYAALLLPATVACSLSAQAEQAASPQTHRPKATAKHPAKPKTTAPEAVAPLKPSSEQASTTELPTIVVTGMQGGQPEGAVEAASAARTLTNFPSPSTRVTKAQIETFNAITTSDMVKYESGVYVRQRYIGDPNAPIGMRGSSPYQSARVMAFVDGLPIWNPLQASYNGTPRWGLASPGETKSVDVIGGPFAAEYSGNAMGGVVNINTNNPQKREIYTEATYMLQPYHYEGSNKNLQGFKTFGSYGDKFGDFSTYFSYNHLENEGQPMTTYNYMNTSGVAGGPLLRATGSALKNPIYGAYYELDPKSVGTLANLGARSGLPRLSYGDNGYGNSIDDLFKWKGNYDINPDLKTNFLLAFENLNVNNTGQSYLANPQGQTIFGTSNYNPNFSSSCSATAGTTTYNYNGFAIAPSPCNLGTSNQVRQTLNMGVGLKGRISDHWNNDTNASYFIVMKDVTIASALNPNDPNFIKNANHTPGGLISRYDNTGWTTFSTKFDNQEFFNNKDLSFATGFQFQHAHLGLTQYNSTNVFNSTENSVAVQSAGSTDTSALFGQLTWRFVQDWDTTLGTRLERWNSFSGVSYKGPTALTGSGAIPQSAPPPDRQKSAFSPKFSLGFEPDHWKFRYSFAQAYRFPIAEELFASSISLNGSQNIANPNLRPENGLHHNLLLEYDFTNGYVRLNLFHENIRNAIYSQLFYATPTSTVLSNTYASIGEEETNGLDLTFNQDRMFGSDFDMKVDTTMLNAKIISNPNNPLYVGKDFPLMPHYRANLLLTYHYERDWDFTVGTRYQSKMYSQLDNRDQQIASYSEFSRSVYVDLKATYRFLEKGHVSMGINNVNNFQGFYNHPLPLRSYFLQVGYNF